jgi:hypothetical protein
MPGLRCSTIPTAICPAAGALPELPAPALLEKHLESECINDRIRNTYIP